MRHSRAPGIVAACVVAAGLLAYAITYRPSTPVKPNTMFAYDQQTFRTTRTVTIAGYELHSLEFRTESGDVEADWYDSSLSAVGSRSGVYATLTVDGQPIVDSLTGSYLGAADAGPATLRWAGWLPAGLHRFEIELSRVDAGVRAPYVLPGQVGVDNLVVTQEPGDG